MVDAVIPLRKERRMETSPGSKEWITATKVKIRYENTGRGWNWGLVHVSGRPKDIIRQRSHGLDNPSWLNDLIRDNMPKGK